MQNTKSTAKKIPLTKTAIYKIILNTFILLIQAGIIVKHTLPNTPFFLGPIYVPLLISTITLIVYIVFFVFYLRKLKNTEKIDELAEQHRYKAGFITKYILIIIIILAILLIKDFSILLTNDTVGNILSIYLIVFSLSEIIEEITFLILEKKDLE